MGDAIKGGETRVQTIVGILDFFSYRRAVEIPRGQTADRLPVEQNDAFAEISRQIMRDVVVFPEPDSPTSPTLSPAAMVIEKSVTAGEPWS
jgi:hypothetical protein